MSRRFPALTPSSEVWLEKDGRRAIDEERARILEYIHATGSITNAAKKLGLSYAYVWNTLARMERIAGERLVDKYRGGVVGGGGATLTQAAKGLLNDYRALQSRLRAFLAPSRLKRSLETKRLFEHPFPTPDLAVMGSHCIGIEILLELLSKRHPSLNYRVLSIGSAGGLAAIMLGEADIAGVHLLDEETGEYNLPFLSRYWMAERCVLVRGYRREQGLYVRKGNPKGVKGLADITRRDVRFINRNLGSGTRALLDRKLRDVSAERRIQFRELVGGIRGYEVEATSHSEVAKAIASRKADVGLGIATVAHLYNLDFIPLAREDFDFALEEKRLRKPYVRWFLQMLQSTEFREAIAAKAPGINVRDDAGNVIYPR